MLTKQRLFSAVIIFIVLPIFFYIGLRVLGDRKYYVLSFLIVVIAFIPFFVRLERKKPSARELVIIAVMSALSIAGRILFMMLPGFKPVTAMTAITGFALGAEAGFLTGALTAFASNMYFGQGPWTPFQMLTWGMIGYIAGLLGKTNIMHHWWALLLFSIFAGFFFSFGMDIWTAMSSTGVFEVAAFKAAIYTALPFTLIYIVSNAIFLFVLYKPLTEQLVRVKTKYNLFS